MLLLCNENIPRILVDALKDRGHDTVWVRIAAPGTSDVDVLAWAIREKRTCLTFDKDFGELVAATDMPAECGVILLRMPPSANPEWALRIASTISGRADWVGNFAVIEPGRIRIKAFGARQKRK